MVFGAVIPLFSPRYRTVALTAGLTAAVACAAAGIGGVALLYLLPALVLACVLLGGRYPGEAVLTRRLPMARTPSRRCSVSRPNISRHAVRLPRGGLLLGFRLAVRPPPAVSPAS